MLISEYIRDDANEELDYFTIIPYNDGEPYISRIAIYSPYMAIMRDGTEYYSDIWYSVDGGEWILYGGDFIDVPCFSKVRFKGNWHEVMKDVEFVANNISSFYAPSFYSESGYDWWLLEGTPLSLIHGDNFKERKNDWTFGWDNFYALFAGNLNVGQVNNPKTFLPSTELSMRCYELMFADSNICNAPELPAETLKESCYYSMFAGCYYLEEAPALNAKTLVPYCYEFMFSNCSNLRYAKVMAIDGFDEENAAAYMFAYNADYGLVMLSQELIDAGFQEAFFLNWAVILEDYPTNEQGYPETKGSIYDYENFCFNVPFFVRYHDIYNNVYYNDFLLEANKLGKELYDFIASWANKFEVYRIKDIFVNRKPVLELLWIDDRDFEDSTGDEWIQLNFYGAYREYYGTLQPDGTFYIFKNDNLIHDYIK